MYPKMAEVLEAARLKTMKEYIALRRQWAAAFVVRRPILIACREAERMHGTTPRQYCQDQGIDWELALEAAEICDLSDALIAAHADAEAEGQSAAAGTFIGIAVVTSGTARRTNPFAVQRTTNVQQHRGSRGEQESMQRGRAGGRPAERPAALHGGTRRANGR